MDDRDRQYRRMLFLALAIAITVLVGYGAFFFASWLQAVICQ